MTALIVDHLTATSPAGLQDRVQRLLAGVAGTVLQPAVEALGLPGGLWCVRRVETSIDLVDVTGGRTDAAIERHWAQSLAGALRQTITDSSPDVVHYPRLGDAVCDLVASLASGSQSRVWAWRTLGLLPAGGPDPASGNRAAVLAVLARYPEHATAAVVSACEQAGVAALHRLLGPAGWISAARIALCAVGQPPSWLDLLDPLDPLAPLGTPAAAPSVAADRDGASPGEHRLMAALGASIAARSRLTGPIRRCPLRVDEQTVLAWAVLAAAAGEPAVFGRPGAGSALRALMSALQRPGEAAPQPAGGDGPGQPRTDHLRAAAGDLEVPASRSAGPDADEPGGGRSRSDRPGQPPVAARATAGRSSAGQDPARGPQTAIGGNGAKAAQGAPNPQRSRDASIPIAEAARDSSNEGRETRWDAGDQWWPTQWAGLVFLLATAQQAGVPAALMAQQALAGQPLGWALCQLGQRIAPVPDRDPALLALAGLAPGSAPPRPAACGDPGSWAATHAVLDRFASRWAEVTADRLPHDHSQRASAATAPEIVQDLVARPGAISGSPGWLEVRLSLRDVDLGVRRAGLDIDPGWVPWLGSVLVIRYE